MTSGIQRMIPGSLSMKVPSIRVFISAGRTGSVAARTTMPAMPSANTRRYGLTCASRRRYSAVLVIAAQYMQNGGQSSREGRRQPALHGGLHLQPHPHECAEPGRAVGEHLLIALVEQVLDAAEEGD